MFERCLYFNANALARAVSRIWGEAYAEFGLSPSHAYLLRLVLAQPGMAQRDIARELRLEKSTVTRFVDALEAQGYLRRRQARGAADRREQGVYPTAKAQEIGAALNATGDRLYRRMQECVGEGALKDLVGQLREVAKALE